MYISWFQKVCRQLHCPALYLPRKGSCIKCVYHSKIAYTINIEVLPAERSNVSVLYNVEQLKHLTSFVMKYFGLQGCRTCDVLCFKTDNYTQVIRYSLQITDMCTKHQILSSVDQNKSQSSLGRLELQGHKVYVNFNQYKDFGKLTLTAHYERGVCISFPSIKGYNCPKVWLNHTELAYIRSLHPAPNGLYYYQESNSGSYVCLENYSTNNDSTSNSYHVSILCICLIFFISENSIVYS